MCDLYPDNLPVIQLNAVKTIRQDRKKYKKKTPSMTVVQM